MAQATQPIDIVISAFGDYNGCGCVMQFDFREQLAAGQRMNPTNTRLRRYDT